MMFNSMMSINVEVGGLGEGRGILPACLKHPHHYPVTTQGSTSTTPSTALVSSSELPESLASPPCRGKTVTHTTTTTIRIVSFKSALNPPLLSWPRTAWTNDRRCCRPPTLRTSARWPPRICRSRAPEVNTRRDLCSLLCMLNHFWAFRRGVQCFELVRK
jgi:hypothetical protein